MNASLEFFLIFDWLLLINVFVKNISNIQSPDYPDQIMGLFSQYFVGLGYKGFRIYKISDIFGDTVLLIMIFSCMPISNCFIALF